MTQFLAETLGWRFLLAMVLASTLWARLTLEQNPQRQDVYPTEIQVEPRGLRDGLVVANEVQPIKLRVVAPQESWRLLQPSSFRAVVNLQNAGPGLVQAEVIVEVSDPEVRIVERIPSKISVRIEELRTINIPVRVNQLGSVPFGYRVVAEPVVTPPQVAVSGPSSAVEKVTEVAVSVRMDEVKATIDRSLKPEPRGPNGVVTGVRLEPQSVTVTVGVEQIAGSKAVSVVPQVRGQPAAGYWQGPIAVDPSTVQIVGDPALLEGVSVLTTADVDITGGQADVVRAVPINRPQGVSIVRDQTATVRVSILPLPGQQVRDVPVTITNLGEGLVATSSSTIVSVNIAGPQPLLLRGFSQDVTASVNAAGLSPGAHVLPVTVQTFEGLRVERVNPTNVTVTIAAAG